MKSDKIIKDLLDKIFKLQAPSFDSIFGWSDLNKSVKEAENYLNNKKLTDSLTIFDIQEQLPWTIHYSREFRESGLTHKDFQHALIHAIKSTGKLATYIDNLEHNKESEVGEIDKYLADLVICAMRMANTHKSKINLQKATIERLETKNNVKLKSITEYNPKPLSFEDWVYINVDSYEVLSTDMQNKVKADYDKYVLSYNNHNNTIKINRVIPLTVEAFDPKGNSLGMINEYEWNDLRVQINKTKTAGYYVIYNYQKIYIDENGGVNNWPTGFFDFNMLCLNELFGI